MPAGILPAVLLIGEGGRHTYLPGGITFGEEGKNTFSSSQGGKALQSLRLAGAGRNKYSSAVERERRRRRIISTYFKKQQGSVRSIRGRGREKEKGPLDSLMQG